MDLSITAFALPTKMAWQMIEDTKEISSQSSIDVFILYNLWACELDGSHIAIMLIIF